MFYVLHCRREPLVKEIIDKYWAAFEACYYSINKHWAAFDSSNAVIRMYEFYAVVVHYDSHHDDVR